MWGVLVGVRESAYKMAYQEISMGDNPQGTSLEDCTKVTSIVLQASEQ